MKKIYISPICEGFLTDQEELLQTSVIISSGADDVDPNLPIPPIGEGGEDNPGFAKGGIIWENTVFD
jgi:hypothetical protein